MPASVPTFAFGFYVVDEVGRCGVIAGPFATLPEADTDRLETSIGEDCGVWERTAAGSFEPCRGYSFAA